MNGVHLEVMTLSIDSMFRSSVKMELSTIESLWSTKNFVGDFGCESVFGICIKICLTGMTIENDILAHLICVLFNKIIILSIVNFVIELLVVI